MTEEKRTRLQRDETSPPLERLRDALRSDDKPTAARALAEHIGGSASTNEHIEALRKHAAAIRRESACIPSGRILFGRLRHVLQSGLNAIDEAITCLEFEWQHRAELGNLDIAFPSVVGADLEPTGWVHTGARSRWFTVRPKPQPGVPYAMVRSDRVKQWFRSVRYEEYADTALTEVRAMLDEAFEYSVNEDDRERVYLRAVVEEMSTTGKAVSYERMKEIRESLDLRTEHMYFANKEAR